MEQKRNLAFYKKSGESWTNEEYQNIINYCNDTINKRSEIIDCLDSHKEKFIFDDGIDENFMYAWAIYGKYGTDSDAFNNCTQIAYEDIFFSGESK